MFFNCICEHMGKFVFEQEFYRQPRDASIAAVCLDSDRVDPRFVVFSKTCFCMCLNRVASDLEILVSLSSMWLCFFITSFLDSS